MRTKHIALILILVTGVTLWLHQRHNREQEQSCKTNCVYQTLSRQHHEMSQVSRSHTRTTLSDRLATPTPMPSRVTPTAHGLWNRDYIQATRSLYRTLVKQSRSISVPSSSPTPSPTTRPESPKSDDSDDSEGKSTQSSSNASLWPGATSVWDGQPQHLIDRAWCLIRHESEMGDPQRRKFYDAENPTSTASGLAQWIDGTWLAHAKYAGVHVVPHASHNSHETQDRVLLWGVQFGLYAWAWDCY